MTRPAIRLAIALVVVLAATLMPSASSAATPTWDVRTTPPAMPGATLIAISADSATSAMPAWGILCSGRYHRIQLDDNEDAVITFAGGAPISYPIWIVGGRDVRVVGLEMSLATQPGCGIGELPNTGSSATNIHPRIPGAMALRLENYGTSFVEGADIDLTGHEADCFVVRNPPDLSNSDARDQRHVVLQNTSCRGIEGLGKSAIGDGVHGDLLQNQGNDVMSSLTLENVSVRTSMEGLVLHEWDGYAGARNLTIRRFDYAADPRYANDDAYEQWGVAFAAWADNWTLEDVYLDDPMGNDYGFVNQQRYGGFAHGVVQRHQAIFRSLPPGGSFAPPALVGGGYRSPHDGITAGTGADPNIASRDQITRLYRAAFGRAPDANGLAYWTERAASGLDLASMAAFFQGSPEWTALFGMAASDSDLIAALYANVLNRAPDAAGRDYWLRRLASGEISTVRLVMIFSESPENVARTASSS